MDSTEKKINRMRAFRSRVENKAGKTDFFHNVTEVLLWAMGGHFILVEYRASPQKISFSPSLHEFVRITALVRLGWSIRGPFTTFW